MSRVNVGPGLDWGRIRPRSRTEEVFERTIGRVNGLVALVRQTAKRGRPPQHASDVLRGALVLALAALDALVLESIIEAIPRLAREGKLGPNFRKWIGEQPEKTLAAFAEDDPHKALADICRDQLGTQPFQKAAAIEGVLRGTLRAEPPWDDAAVILSSTGSPWTAEEVKERLDAFVLRRHRIVHDGDLVTGRKSTRPILRGDVQEAVDIVRAVGEAVLRSIHRVR
jgi:hypothetical protein